MFCFHFENMHLRTMLNSKNPVYDFSNLVVALSSDRLLAE